MSDRVGVPPLRIGCTQNSHTTEQRMPRMRDLLSVLHGEVGWPFSRCGSLSKCHSAWDGKIPLNQPFSQIATVLMMWLYNCSAWTNFCTFCIFTQYGGSRNLCDPIIRCQLNVGEWTQLATSPTSICLPGFQGPDREIWERCVFFWLHQCWKYPTGAELAE